jgi:hypothetical protein
MDARFLQSWFNSDHRVLGRKLHPFCLYDALILAADGSPFVAEEEGPVPYSLSDLQVAVAVCSGDPHRFLGGRFMSGWWERLRVRAWGWRIRRAMRRDPGYLDRQGEAFNAYLLDHNAGPRFWSDGEASEMRAPWLLANVTFLISKTSLDREEAWTMPLGQALWYAGTLAEQMGTGGSEIMTVEEEAAMQEMADMSPEEEEKLLAVAREQLRRIPKNEQ